MPCPRPARAQACMRWIGLAKDVALFACGYVHDLSRWIGRGCAFMRTHVGVRVRACVY